MKLIRLHHSLGPQNIAPMLANKQIRTLLKSAGVNIEKFEKLVQS